MSVRDLLANAMGCPSWMMQAPSPFEWCVALEGWPVWSDHSISGVWGGLSATGDLIFWKQVLVFSSHAKQFSFLRRAHSGSVFELRWGMNVWSVGWRLLGTTVALVSSGVVSSQRSLGSSLDRGSSLQRKTHRQRMSLTPVWWNTFCC